ncbi:CG2 omega domain protein [Vibrio harveyi]|uniref:CG2 omega domain protein n=1 Tax=Vibrio harveyi TaxID=669 RepID=UPI001EFCC5CE|nr:CG2 omega domain protein [Vibrio harveyi]MCG9236964.1 CG2 omega domain protein [Vibrio harveyi]MCG9585321.1 CG2 omega domain protein [Vibrio harveyi]CAH1202391.1 CG2 omega domain protein [Vibrio harveyi]CAH1557473.1 CG2 omega domain protein [Vibrio harveyi]CAH1577891.1 CG2 omega domain protein [Vibrio harveyi]
MKKLLLLAAVIMPLAPAAYADITIKGDDFELSEDCLRLDGDNVSIKSDDCSGKHDKGKGKGNASIHGDDNPGKGHGNDKGKGKNKGKNDD